MVVGGGGWWRETVKENSWAGEEEIEGGEEVFSGFSFPLSWQLWISMP